jgi:sugar phosphate isomerase/epimerase
MLLGYNTNGFAFHRLDDALDIIAELGYRCVAITVDHHVLNPFAPDIRDQVDHTRSQLDSLGLASVIETGARFLLDPRRKHQPTLLDRRAAGRDRRADFLRHCIDIAAALGSSAVSFWSGAMPPGQDDAVAYERLAESCRELAGLAADRGLVLAFEPEPGMLVDSLAGYERLAAAVEHDAFRLTIDVGHLQCNEPDPPPILIERFADRLANVHLDDMRRGVHDHLFFGEGEVDFASVFRALGRARYDGPACVELSRHSHNALEVAREAKGFIDRAGGRQPAALT